MTVLAILFWLVVFGLIARAVMHHRDRHDQVSLTDADGLREVFRDLPGVRVQNGFVSWRDDFRLPAPVDGGVSLVLPPTLRHAEVLEYFSYIRPILDHGYRIRLHRGVSPFIGEVGLAAQRAGAEVRVFHDANREVEGMILVPSARPRRAGA